MKTRSQKTIILIGFVLVAILLVGGVIYFYPIRNFRGQEEIGKQLEKVGREPCLVSNEFADYYPRLPIALKPVTISVKDKNTNQEKFSFQIENTSKAFHALEMYKCNIYVIRVFNYDDERGVPLPDYRTELWQFHYGGVGRKLIDLFKREGAPDNYSQDFRIDPAEIYIALGRKYLGDPNHALVFKDLKTKEDVFVLSLKDITEKHPSLTGSIGLREWTKDGRYFWGDIFIGAYILGFFRIDTTDWKAEIFPAPKDVLGGDALNVEKGYITVHPGNVWFGIAELTEEEKARRRAQDIGTELYIHNLFTNERYFVDKTDEPLWYFKPKWISDTELEYEFPTGEKKIYKIEEE